MEKDMDVQNNLLLENSKVMVVAACWSTLENIEAFSVFPEILSVDTTYSTNKKERPLVIAPGKDTTGRKFSAFWCFVPSAERLLKFAFGHIIPSLLGHKNIRRLKLCNTDG
jgi:hypothetical protein